MSAIFGEYLIFHQENGPDVELIVNGDEFYARYETIDGYTVVYDLQMGLFCYADLLNGEFISTATPLSKQPPVGLRKHLKESAEVRNRKFEQRYDTIRPPQPAIAPHIFMTIGPNRGLLQGRRLSEGVVRGLTVLVEFADLQTTVTTADINELLNGQNYTANGNFCSVREYYRTVSNGKMDYQNVVIGPVRLSKPQAFYKTTLFVKEVMDIVAAQMHNDFSQFDSRNEGIIDALNFMYAGRTLYEGDLWPHNSFINLQYGSYRTNLYMLTSAGRSPVDLSIGTFCHESGHLLCRFPDMYDYGERDGDFEESAGIGVYCLMGSGNHLNRGRTPSPVSGYLRDLVGWPDNVVSLNNVGTFQARHGDYGTVYKFETNKLNEYFIIENRSKLGLDSFLPSSGLAVFHCDWLGSNEWQGGTPDSHYQCGLLQADGHLDLEKNLNTGDATDLFGERTGICLSNQTTPSSLLWDHSDSAMIVGNVSAPGEVITFSLGKTVEGNIVCGEITADKLIPDRDPLGIESFIQIAQVGRLKTIKTHVSITHTRIGDLLVMLVSPSGKQVTLHNRTGGTKDDISQDWDSVSFPALAELKDEPIQGTWTLAVRDGRGWAVGRLNWWNIEIEYETVELRTTGSVEPHLQIPDADQQGVQSVITIAELGCVKDILVSVEITHTYRGDLLVELVSPSGRSATVHNRTGGSVNDLKTSYDVATAPVLQGLLGETIQGDWILRVRDMARIDNGTLDKWSLTLIYN